MADILNVMIGWDSREQVASEVAAHSIRKRTRSNLNTHFLKHRELRDRGLFKRHWSIDSDTGNFRDDVDGKPFSTEFSHTRFLVPLLMGYKGWALFMDADMIFQSDIQKLFGLCDDRYAVMCVKHKQEIKYDHLKMDGRPQQGYFRKNWSSFMLWNCGHQANQVLTPEYVSFHKGSDLHQLKWLPEHLIGSLPISYNYISGVSPKLDEPDVIHYTEGGPWFSNCMDVPYADLWLQEYESFQRDRDDYFVTETPTMACDK